MIEEKPVEDSTWQHEDLQVHTDDLRGDAKRVEQEVLGASSSDTVNSPTSRLFVKAFIHYQTERHERVLQGQEALHEH